MRAFVTGATGFLGRHLVRELLAHGYDVTAMVRTFERMRQLPDGVRPMAGDITQRDTLAPGLRDADVAFHLAALRLIGLPPKQAAWMQRINVDGARNVLALAVEMGVPKIVHTSSVLVYGDTRGQLIDEAHLPQAVSAFESEYQRTKHAAHFEVAVPLQQSGAPIVIACPGMAYGPGDQSQFARLLRLYALRRLPVMIGADNALAWTHAADIALGLRLAAEKGRPGETYMLAGQPLTYREFFRVSERATGLPAPWIWLPSPLARGLARVLRRLLPAAAERLDAVGGVTYLARADKAQRELGWQARPVAEGVSETIAWLRAGR